MNKIFLSALLCSSVAAFAANKDSDDPVVMTINGEDVPLSEFEYLYTKNNNQQLEPMSFDEYVGKFVDYKLKVIDACANGMDTTQAFIKEFGRFRDELSAPLLLDTATQNRLIREQYQRMGYERRVSHIMLPLEKNEGENFKQQLDSIRDLIVSGQQQFEDMARFSVDRNSAMRRGLMGWIRSNGSLPWQFEEAAYNTPLGEISPVINSGFGYHIIRPEKERKQRGEVSVQHILLLTRGMSSEEAEHQKEKADSIYQLTIQPGADFAALAKKYSEDPGSAPKGGDLGWFGGGKMVAEFDSVSFALPIGAISEPFATSYGYHIVKKNDARGQEVPALEEVKPQIVAQMEKDGRIRLALDATAKKIAEQYGAKVNPYLKREIMEFLASRGARQCDTLTLKALFNSNIKAYTINNEDKTLNHAMRRMQIRPEMSAFATAQAIEKAAYQAMDNDLLALGRDQLIETNKDFRNLVNEYRDGILLFDISNQKVWDKASKDKEGLEAFYQANKSKYTWDKPHFKGYVFLAMSDSIMQQALDKAPQVLAECESTEEFPAKMKKSFGNQLRIEYVVAGQGDNEFIDYVAFNGPQPDLSKQRMQEIASFQGQILNQPQEASDVKGQVVTDYQAQLEEDWIKYLHKTYPVKINKKNLKKAQQAQ